jgi:hypothetical protein
MVPPFHTSKAMVLLIGNYPPDRQQSMQRFAMMMLDGLIAAGVPAELIQPQPFFGRFRPANGFVAKWLAYIDKFVLFPRNLRRKLKAAPALVHICDHSNAMYAKQIRGLPVVSTCHDLLAVRGALGEQTDCPASATGKLLQRWILSGSCGHKLCFAGDTRRRPKAGEAPEWKTAVGSNFTRFELSLSTAAFARSPGTIDGLFRSRWRRAVCPARRLELAAEKSRGRPTDFRAMQRQLERVACVCRGAALRRAPFLRPAIGRLGSVDRGSPCVERIT